MTLKEYFEPKAKDRTKIIHHARYFVGATDCTALFVGDKSYMFTAHTGGLINLYSSTPLPVNEDELEAWSRHLIYPSRITRKDGKPLGGVVEQPKPLLAGTVICFGPESTYTLVLNGGQVVSLLQQNHRVISDGIGKMSVDSLLDASMMGYPSDCELIKIVN